MDVASYYSRGRRPMYPTVAQDVRVRRRIKQALAYVLSIWIFNTLVVELSIEI